MSNHNIWDSNVLLGDESSIKVEVEESGLGVTVTDKGARGEPGIIWRGDWNASFSYSVGDAVTRSGTAWICVKDNQSVSPPSEGDGNFNLLASGDLNVVMIDEDAMLSDSDTKVPTQQSVKAYVDGEIGQIQEIGADEIKTKYITTNKAFTDTQYDKLYGIESGATADLTALEVMNLYESNSGREILFTDAYKDKLDDIEYDATRDMTSAEIKTAYQGEIKAFTDGQYDKLFGIEALANYYIHPWTDGNKHIPSGGSAGQFLKYSASGTAIWSDDYDTTYSAADGATYGLSLWDFNGTYKTKLDGIDTGANLYVHPTGGGYEHVPVVGSDGTILTVSSGSAAWVAPQDPETLKNSTHTTEDNTFTVTNPPDWFTIASSDGFSLGRFALVNSNASREHQLVFYVNFIEDSESSSITVLENSFSNSLIYTGIRLKVGTLGDAKLQVQIDSTDSNDHAVYMLGDNAGDTTWSLSDFSSDTYSSHTVRSLLTVEDRSIITSGSIAAHGDIYVGSTKVVLENSELVLAATTALTMSGADVTLTKGDGTTDVITIPGVGQATGITDIVQDTTPQLGGDLDGQNTYDIINIGTVDGRDLSVDGTKLDNIESNATADQTDAEIKTAYENNADTNEFSDAEQTKLSGIDTGAQVNPTSHAIAFITGLQTALNTKATTTYVDQEIASTLVSEMSYKGGYNASTNSPNLDAASPVATAIGDVYVVTVAGTFFTIALDVGDMLIAEQASAIAEANWTIVSKKLDAVSIKTSYESNNDTNEFSDTEQTKLSGIDTGAEVNVQSDWNSGSGDSLILNKPNIQYTAVIPDATSSQTGLATSIHITKLDGITTGANLYALPEASTTVLGGIKVGANLTITSGVLAATDTDTTYSVATTSVDGLMSSTDKTKLDGVATSATANPNALDNLVEDTTPELGGTLQANSHNIDMGSNIITDTKVGQWGDAYNWGDHSIEGYISTQAEVRGHVGGMVVGNTETRITVLYDNITQTFDFVVDDDLSNYSNTNTGFLQDSEFGSSGIMLRGSAGSYSILADNSSNWNLAHGWGDHGGAGYQASATLNAAIDTHLNQSNPTTNYVLSWNGSDYAWVAQSGGSGSSSGPLSDHSNVSGMSPGDGDLLTYNLSASKWEPAGLDVGELSNHSNVSGMTPSDGYVLTYNLSASKWEPAASSGGGGGSSLAYISESTDKVLISPANELQITAPKILIGIDGGGGIPPTMSIIQGRDTTANYSPHYPTPHVTNMTGVSMNFETTAGMKNPQHYNALANMDQWGFGQSQYGKWHGTFSNCYTVPSINVTNSAYSTEAEVEAACNATTTGGSTFVTNGYNNSGLNANQKIPHISDSTGYTTSSWLGFCTHDTSWETTGSAVGSGTSCSSGYTWRPHGHAWAWLNEAFGNSGLANNKIYNPKGAGCFYCSVQSDHLTTKSACEAKQGMWLHAPRQQRATSGSFHGGDPDGAVHTSTTCAAEGFNWSTANEHHTLEFDISVPLDHAGWHGSLGITWGAGWGYPKDIKLESHRIHRMQGKYGIKGVRYYDENSSNWSSFPRELIGIPSGATTDDVFTHTGWTFEEAAVGDCTVNLDTFYGLSAGTVKVNEVNCVTAGGAFSNGYYCKGAVGYEQYVTQSTCEAASGGSWTNVDQAGGNIVSTDGACSHASVKGNCYNGGTALGGLGHSYTKANCTSPNYWQTTGQNESPDAYSNELKVSGTEPLVWDTNASYTCSSGYEPRRARVWVQDSWDHNNVSTQTVTKLPDAQNANIYCDKWRWSAHNNHGGSGYYVPQQFWAYIGSTVYGGVYSVGKYDQEYVDLKTDVGLALSNTGSENITRHWVPENNADADGGNGAFDLGSSSNLWRVGYFDEIKMEAGWYKQDLWCGVNVNNHGSSVALGRDVALKQKAAQTTSSYVGENSVWIGRDAFRGGRGDNNVAIGYKAFGASTQDGNGNVSSVYHSVAIGFEAGADWLNGANNQYSEYNTLFGYQAASKIIHGSGIIAIGSRAVGGRQSKCSDSAYITSGTCTGAGHTWAAGTASTHQQIGIGYEALDRVDWGHYNIGLGYQAGRYLQFGSQYNTAIGYRALGWVQTGCTHTDYDNQTDCEAAGQTWGYTSQGSYNVAVGPEALGMVRNTSENVAVGRRAFRHLSNGNNNVAVGRLCAEAVRYAFQCTFMGNETGYGQSTSQGVTAYNTMIGAKAGRDCRIKNYNTFIGYQAGVSFNKDGTSNTSTNNTFIGYNAGTQLDNYQKCSDTNYTNQTDCEAASQTWGYTTEYSNHVVLGNSSVTDFMCQVALTTGSDMRDKSDITDFHHGLNFVKAMRPVTYKWDLRGHYEEGETPDGTHKDSKLQLGFIAQEVREIEESIGYSTSKDDMLVVNTKDENSLRMKEANLVPILVNAIKELSDKVDALQEQINNM